MAISTRSDFSSNLDFNFGKKSNFRKGAWKKSYKRGLVAGSGTVFMNWFIFDINVHIFASFDVSQLFVRKDNNILLDTLWIYLYFRSFGTPLLLLVPSAEKSYNFRFCKTYIVHLLTSS